MPILCFLLLPVPSLLAGDRETQKDKSDGWVRSRSAFPLSQEADLKSLPASILKDQGTLWLEPFRVRNREDVVIRSMLVGVTANLMFLDRSTGRELSDSPPGDLHAFSDKAKTFSGIVPVMGTAGSFLLAGKLSGDDRASRTGVLSIRAVSDAFILTEAIKSVSRRPRPTSNGGTIRNHGADGEFFTGGRSFPSGHSSQAWALATVVAHQYADKRWVPPVSYGLAGAVGVLRVTDREHFPSDVFVGSVIGFFIGRHVIRSARGDSDPAPSGWNLETSATPDGGMRIGLQWTF